jgi:hypothetical protein
LLFSKKIEELPNPHALAAYVNYSNNNLQNALNRGRLPAGVQVVAQWLEFAAARVSLLKKYSHEIILIGGNTVVQLLQRAIFHLQLVL